jgi:hypothetical protein
MDTLVGYAEASTQRVGAGNGIEYAYRDLGEGVVPLVLLQHFRGNLARGVCRQTYSTGGVSR